MRNKEEILRYSQLQVGTVLRSNASGLLWLLVELTTESRTWLDLQDGTTFTNNIGKQLDHAVTSFEVVT